MALSRFLFSRNTAWVALSVGVGLSLICISETRTGTSMAQGGSGAQAESLVCGNGTLSLGEECDDGNTMSGDGCSSTCQLESVSLKFAATASGYNLDANEFISPTPSGLILGDPAPGKLVPYWAIGGDLATIIHIENTSGNAGPNVPTNQPDEGSGGDIRVHVTAFTAQGLQLKDVDICLSPFDLGSVVLQEPSPAVAQLDRLRLGRDFIFSRDEGDLGSVTTGYVSLKAISKHSSTDGTCKVDSSTVLYDEVFVSAAEPLATWATLENVGNAHFATEIPTPTALVDSGRGVVTGGPGAFGLVPAGNTIVARFDVSPQAQTSIFVWLENNAFAIGDPDLGMNRPQIIAAYLECEDGLEISTTLSLPDKVNIINPNNLAGVGQCKVLGQFRGALRFTLPAHGFVWAQTAEAGQHLLHSAVGYNLDANAFISSTPSGQVAGDSAPGKLIPFYRISENLATTISVENVDGKAGSESGRYVNVHTVLFTVTSEKVLDFNLCLPPFEFGSVVLQESLPTGSQLDEIAARGSKVKFISIMENAIPSQGYVTLRATGAGSSCAEAISGATPFSTGDSTPLTTWAWVYDVGTGSGVIDIPTPTALVNPVTGESRGGTGAFGLTPSSNTVIARFDVNPLVQAKTEIFRWLATNAFVIPNDPTSQLIRPGSYVSFLDCEDEHEVSSGDFLPDEMNVTDPNFLPGISQCRQLGLFRGVLRFAMPDTGFVWSQLQLPVVPAQPPDLSLKVTNPESIVLGEKLTYTFTVTNKSESLSSATNVTIMNELPQQRLITVPGLEVVRTGGGVQFHKDLSSTSCEEFSPATVTCKLGGMAPGEKREVTIVITPVGAGRIENRAVVSAEEGESTSNDNAVVFQTQILPPRQNPTACRTIPALTDFPPPADPRQAYVLIGTPFDLSPPDPRIALQPLGRFQQNLWRMVRFNANPAILPDLGEYIKFSPDDGLFDFLSGRGFWLIARNRGVLNVSGPLNDTAQLFNIKLQPGPAPQQIATPFNFPPGFTIDWSGCVVPVLQALQLPVKSFLCGYTGQGQGIKGQGYSIEETMQPMVGYWIFNEAGAPVTLPISPECVMLDASSTSSPDVCSGETTATIPTVTQQALTDVPSPKRSSSLLGWRLKLSVSIGTIADTDNYLGVDAMAQDGPDALDYPEPPPIHGVSLSFPHPEWNAGWVHYTTDIRGMDEGKSQAWDFEVVTDTPNAQVKLSWSFSGMRGKSLTLRDIDNSQIVKMRETSRYTYNTESRTVRHFRIVTE